MTSYEMRELAMFRRQMEDTEKLPLAERKANAVEWYKDLSENYMMVAERVGWLLNGSYGKGSFDSACRVLASPRMNQVAWCAITIANLEWRCPAKFAIQAWKKLPVEKRYLVNEAIRQEIADAKREGYCGEIKKNPTTQSSCVTARVVSRKLKMAGFPIFKDGTRTRKSVDGFLVTARNYGKRVEVDYLGYNERLNRGQIIQRQNVAYEYLRSIGYKISDKGYIECEAGW